MSISEELLISDPRLEAGGTIFEFVRKYALSKQLVAQGSQPVALLPGGVNVMVTDSVEVLTWSETWTP